MNRGGGGGGGGSGGTGAAGGSGIVIISYVGDDLTSIGAGLTYSKTANGTSTVYQFTAGTGTITV
jgi:hypothetical protein